MQNKSGKVNINEVNEELSDQLKWKGYTLSEPIGWGGSGSVYRAEQSSTGQVVAIKVLHLKNIRDEQEQQKKIKRFERETQLCAELIHPHIVKLLDKGIISENRFYAVFEYIPGKTFKELILQRKTIPAGEVKELMAQTLDALACAHDHGIVHRDLKPQNIMITSTGARTHVKVLDFGIGTFIPEARPADYTSLTDSKEMIGTPAYCAPEQLRGDPPTIKSDLYAWGLVLLECLTGQPVMQGDTLAEIYHKQLSPIEIPLPAGIVQHELAPLLRRVLKKNPKERAGDTKKLYADFMRLNLNTLVGDLSSAAGFLKNSNEEPTDLNVSFWAGIQSEQRQITVLCCNLSVKTLDNSLPDFEIIETIQRDQLSLCHDTGLRYGGYVTGNMGNSLMLYFGYPNKTDNDARLAARTALELTGDVRRRNSLLKEQHGIKLELRIGIHTGMVLVREQEAPAGMTPNIALHLENLAPAGSIVISKPAMELIKQYAECEETNLSSITTGNKVLKTYFLTGEKKSEALTFLVPGKSGWPLIGREFESNQIQKIWDSVKESGRRNLFISGEGGIGKSRLVYEIYRSIIKEGFLTKDCRCLPEQRNSALYPILEMLKVHLEILTPDDSGRGVKGLENILHQCGCQLELAVPILCSWLSLPLPEQYTPLQHSPDRQMQILFDVLEKIILSFSKENPFVFFIEDLHWIDPTSLELLDRLIKKELAQSFLLIMTARLEFSNPWDIGLVDTLVLEGLSKTAIETMIKKITGGKKIDEHTLATLVSRSDGIPLYIEELTYMLLENGYLTEKDGILVLEDTPDAETIPVTLQNLLDARLNRLGCAKETLQIAAAIGREFDYALLVSTSLKNEGTIQNELQTLLSTNLIFRQRLTKGELYIFRHALIRDAAYESMPLSVRKETHLWIANTYETRFPHFAIENPSELARHFGSAGVYAKAVHYETEAAKTALQRSLNDDTITHSQRVLQWADNLPVDRQQEAELTINMYLTQALMGKYGWADERVKERADRSLALLSKVTGSVETVPALWNLATYHHVAGNRQAVRDLTAELTRITDQANDPGLKVAAATFMGLRYQVDGEYRKGVQVLELALKLYNPQRDKGHALTFGFDTRVWSEATGGVVYWFSGYDTKAEKACENAIAYARELNHIPSLCIALLYYGLVSYHERNRNRTLKMTTELLELADKYGLPAYAGYGSIIHCWATGEPEKIHEILGGLQYLGCKLALSLYTAIYAEALAQKGAIEQAIRTIDTCLGYCKENDEHGHEAALYIDRATYELKLYPEGNESIHTCLLKALELGRSQQAFRIETQAILVLSKLYGPESIDETRLADLLSSYPEIRHPDSVGELNQHSAD